MKLYTFRESNDKDFPILIVSHGKFDVAKIATNASVMEIMTIMDALNGNKHLHSVADTDKSDFHIHFITHDMKAIYMEEGEYSLKELNAIREWAIGLYVNMSEEERLDEFGLIDFFPGNENTQMLFRAEFKSPQNDRYGRGETDLTNLLDDLRRSVENALRD